MDLLNQLIRQHPQHNPLHILIIGERRNREAIRQMEELANQALAERHDQNRRASHDSKDECFSLEVDRELWQSPKFESWVALINGAVTAEQTTLFLPLIDLSTWSDQAAPAGCARKVVQWLQIIESLNLLHILPVLLSKPNAPAVAVARLVATMLNRQGYAGYIATAQIKAVGGTINESQTLPAPVLSLVERWGRLSVAILAAGKSSRMGRAKQLEPVNGIPMVMRSVATALQSGADRVFLVTGAYADEVTSMLRENKVLEEIVEENSVQKETGLIHQPLVQIIHNPHYADGQSTSVHAVINHLDASTIPTHQSLVAPRLEAITFMPVDQPFLPPVILSRLFRLWRRGVQIAAPSVGGIPRGAPALFDRLLWPQFTQLTGDVGAKVLLRQFAEKLMTIDVPEEMLFDIDTPADLPRSS